jgi:hypothetical protein
MLALYSCSGDYSILQYVSFDELQLTGFTGINSKFHSLIRFLYQENWGLYIYLTINIMIALHHVWLSFHPWKLENLNLSANQLNSSILSILSGLSSLKSLDLSYNMLTGSGMIHSFYLANCFTWHSLNYIVSLSRKMRTLYLCNDQFNDSILSC